ncbi:TERF1-interacting nuclear factor 2 [Phasianus colchicus]|uniref:TERF1-interacting nuclear factor 2 n=1 Tax=Phasianus colchicus TaxID=9054 RepID=UPI00129D3822|nr:TERF1-interacting nuclear factor 2 [Phasianus colchicus]
MNGRDTGSPSALRVALAGAWQAVRGRRLRHFPRVLALLEAVGRAAPAALSCQHGVRLRLGLQAAVVHSLLHEEHSEPQLFDSIDRFFPEGATPNLGGGRAVRPCGVWGISSRFPPISPSFPPFHAQFPLISPHISSPFPPFPPKFSQFPPHTFHISHPPRGIA